jgi:hypothetical protein
MRPSRGRLSAPCTRSGIIYGQDQQKRRRWPQFGRASVGATHYLSADNFQQIDFSATFAMKKICLILTRVSGSD